VLVITQIIRLIQNTIQLRKQDVLFKKQLKELADAELTERDFETQRKAYRLAVEYLEHRVQQKMEIVEDGK
jgi:DNA-binding transcriptional ArsR family regulator